MNCEENFVSDFDTLLLDHFFGPLIKYEQTLFCFTQMLCKCSLLSVICTFSLFISPDFGIADHFIDRAVNVNNISNHRPIFKNLTNQKKMDSLKTYVSYKQVNYTLQ